ncbi:UNVERIFIED_CONTAM: Eukaryotic translation initiation factor 3 subunit M [Sesamum radiatum]|uniref:Eukaryotic translation initiation factor 3 subunit M n=1 Tax=Sesamum radiatum TaxID=300843 RepID=A0AAW2VA44_SESRA
MGRGTSAGGGQSSLGYLFGNGEAPNPQEPKDAINEPSSKPTAPPPEADSSKQTQAPAGYSTNNYYRTDGQNCGNFITYFVSQMVSFMMQDRPTTKGFSSSQSIPSIPSLLSPPSELSAEQSRLPNSLSARISAFPFQSSRYDDCCPTSEIPPAVVRFTAELSWADAGPEVAQGQVNRLCLEAQECMIQNRWLDLASLMLTSADVIFSKASEKDLECAYTVICNLVNKPESLDQVHEMAELIATKVAHQLSDKHVLPKDNPYSQFFVYMKALNLAVSGEVAEYVVPSFKKMDNFLREWNLGVKDQRDLFLTVANILKDSKSSAKDSFNFLVKYLETFSGGDALTVAEAKEEAVHAIIEFVKAPDMFQGDLLDMPAIAQLEKDAVYALEYQLLKIFLTQRLDAYLDFHSSNSDFLERYGLVHEDCVAKMRLISLVDLGNSGSGQIPYSLIKDTLQIEENEVESWVVKAITAKLIDCRIDQINQVVLVSRCTERVFGLHEWESLRSKLVTWRGNIANVISTIQANKISEDGTQAVQGVTTR